MDPLKSRSLSKWDKIHQQQIIQSSSSEQVSTHSSEYYKTKKNTIDESRFIKKDYSQYHPCGFYEIFNNKSKKCPIKIPDTIFVQGNQIHSWYFSSSVNGAVLKKKTQNLSIIEVFKAIYKQSPLMIQEEIFRESDDNFFENQELGDDEDEVLISQPKRVSLSNNIEQDQDYKGIISLNKIIREFQIRPNSGKDLTHKDKNLPFIAYAKFNSQKSRPLKPYELFTILNERLNEIKMLQTFVYSRGQEVVQNQQNHEQYISGGNYLVYYTNYDPSMPPSFAFYKTKLSKELTSKLNSRLKSVNQTTNQRLQEASKVLISFLEQTEYIILKKISLKFIENVQGEIVFIGLRNQQVLYLNKSKENINSVTSISHQNTLDSQQKPKQNKQVWRKSNKTFKCYGDFCGYRIESSEKYLFMLKNSKIVKQDLIPDQNKIFESDSRAQDHNKAKNHQRQISIYSKPPKYQKKQIYADNYNTLYKQVTVCQKCFLIYKIMSEFFSSDEKQQANIIHKLEKRNSLEPSLKTLEQIENDDEEEEEEDKDSPEKQIILKAQKRLTLQIDRKQNTGQDLLAKKQMFTMKNNTTMEYDYQGNRKSNLIIKQNTISIVNQLKGLGDTTLLISENNKKQSFNKTQTFNFYSQDKINQITRTTESLKMRQIPKISYRLAISKLKKDSKTLQDNQSSKQESNNERNASQKLFIVRQNNIGKQNLFLNTESKLQSIKQTMGLSLRLSSQGLNSPNDRDQRESFISERGQGKKRHKSSADRAQIINFFYEVSKDIKKYEIKKDSMTPPVDQKQANQSQFLRLKQLTQSTPQRKMLKDQENQNKIYQLSNPQAISNDNKLEQQNMTKTQQTFTNRVQEAILKYAQRYIAQYLEQQQYIKFMQSNEEINNNDSYHFSNETSPAHSKRNSFHNSAIKKRQTIRQQTQLYQNITTSLFHYQKLQHLQQVPYYRVSTPKVPIFSFDKIDDSVDDKYVIPADNYKTMDIQLYCDLLKISKELSNLEDASVFLIDENTSIIYEVISNFNENSDQNYKIKNYIVLLDLFDSYLLVKDFFKKIIQNLKPLKVRFILLNLPGQVFTKYNHIRSLLNNNFYATCLDLLLFHLHERDIVNFIDEPFSIIAFGNGANLALYYTTMIKDFKQNLHSLLLFNAFTHLDSQMKNAFETILHNYKKDQDHRKGNNNQSELDYCDFFYYNLVYSTEIIQRVQKWIMEKDTEKLGKKESLVFMRQLGRKNKIDLCQGFLNNISLQDKIKNIDRTNIISVHSQNNSFLNHLHKIILTQNQQNLPVESQIRSQVVKLNPDIQQTLSNKGKHLSLKIDGGHNVIVENKKALKKIINEYIIQSFNSR